MNHDGALLGVGILVFHFSIFLALSLYDIKRKDIVHEWIFSVIE
ncbi:hypothetical protein bcere0022_14000 [Bacillus cereus Rock3-44]|nr:hypothetical protein bcere0022_14000 [Bacillus cereus Rock3-44]